MTSLTYTISVTIINDNVVEGNQSFFGTLGNPVGPVDLDPSQATVTIQDNDRKYQSVVYTLVCPSMFISFTFYVLNKAFKSLQVSILSLVN